jgi:uncharacterized membrane protein YgdD (TMEM256/DUF423 family)
MLARRFTAGLFGVIAIALGAFGAHGLKSHWEALPEGLVWWQTATHYLLVHAVTLAAVPLPSIHPGKCPATYWVSGIFIFSGTLYALALGAPRWLGMVTPVGGILLLVGWLTLAWQGWKGLEK